MREKKVPSIGGRQGEGAYPPKRAEYHQTVEGGDRGGPKVMVRNIMGNKGRKIKGDQGHGWP